MVVRSDIKPQLAVGNDEEREATATVAASASASEAQKQESNRKVIVMQGDSLLAFYNNFYIRNMSSTVYEVCHITIESYFL